MAKHTLAVALVALLVVTALAVYPSSAEGGPSAQSIGTYQQLGQTKLLTTDHASWEGEVLIVEGPAFTRQLAVEASALSDLVGPWSSSEAFEVLGGAAKFDGRRAFIDRLEIDATPAFTWGHQSHIQFVERPMWVSAQQDELGGTITLSMQDGDSAGQLVSLGKEWLWERGIYRPNVTHEDGTWLEAAETSDGTAFIIDVHHFSALFIRPEELDIRTRTNGVISPFLGDRWWYPDQLRLEVVMPAYLSLTEVLVEKGWVDFHMPWVGLRGDTWTEEWPEISQRMPAPYYVVELPFAKPRTIVFEQFYPTSTPTFTLGNPESVSLWAVNESSLRSMAPMAVRQTSYDGFQLDMERGGDYRLQLDKSWLASWNVLQPHFMQGTENVFYFEAFDGNAWILELAGSALVTVTDITGETIEYLRESRRQSIVIDYDRSSTTFSVGRAAYIPWLGDQVDVLLVGFNWMDHGLGEGHVVRLEFMNGDESLASAEPEFRPRLDESEPIEYQDLIQFAVTVTPDLILPAAVPNIKLFLPESSLVQGIAGKIVSRVADPTTSVFKDGPACPPNSTKVDLHASTIGVVAHKDDHTHDQTSTAFISTNEGVGSWAWKKPIWYSSCMGTDNPRWTGSTAFGLAFGERGRTLWGYDDYQTQWVFAHVQGGGNIWRDGVNHGWVKVREPTLHLANPSTNAGAPLASWNGVSNEGRQPNENCSIDIKNHILSTLGWWVVGLFGPEGQVISLIGSLASIPKMACTTFVQGITSSVTGIPGGGPRMKNLNTWGNAQAAGATHWVTDTPAAATHTGIFRLDFEPSMEFEYQLRSCYCGWAKGTFISVMIPGSADRPVMSFPPAGGQI